MPGTLAIAKGGKKGARLQFYTDGVPFKASFFSSVAPRAVRLHAPMRLLALLVLCVALASAGSFWHVADIHWDPLYLVGAPVRSPSSKRDRPSAASRRPERLQEERLHHVLREQLHR